jgi:hypothetical protein
MGDVNNGQQQQYGGYGQQPYGGGWQGSGYGMGQPMQQQGGDAKGAPMGGGMGQQQPQQIDMNGIMQALQAQQQGPQQLPYYPGGVNRERSPWATPLPSPNLPTAQDLQALFANVQPAAPAMSNGSRPNGGVNTNPSVGLSDAVNQLRLGNNTAGLQGLRTAAGLPATGPAMAAPMPAIAPPPSSQTLMGNVPNTTLQPFTPPPAAPAQPSMTVRNNALSRATRNSM